MADSLQCLFQAIAQARDEADLKQSIMARLGQYFAARRWGLSFLDEFLPAESPTSDEGRSVSPAQNPILHYLIQRHTAVHDEVILPEGVWQTVCPRDDHGHVMIGPIVRSGQLVGGIAFTRYRDDDAFNDENLADLNALSLHISTKLAALRSQPAAFGANCNRLTPREAQIVELVAQGLTSKEIGAVLWITENSVKQALKRIFRKLNVSSRAEMVAKLSANTSASS
jgi:DNA-binding CsgD family transcriptional regulator